MQGEGEGLTKPRYGSDIDDAVDEKAPPADRSPGSPPIRQTRAPITWDPGKRVLYGEFVGVKFVATGDETRATKITIPMPQLYEIRVRPSGAEEWGLGVLLPFPTVAVIGAEPGRPYEVRTTVVASDGKALAEPVVETIVAKKEWQS